MVDESGFRKLMQEQRDRAKADAKSKKAGAQAVEVYRNLRDSGETPFTGYTELASESTVRGIVADGELVEASEEGDVVEVVLDRTLLRRVGWPGLDAGVITGEGVSLEVVDVQRPVKGLIVHRVRITKGELLRGAGAGRRRRRVAAWRLPGALGYARHACGPPAGAGADRAAERFIQQARLPPA